MISKGAKLVRFAINPYSLSIKWLQKEY